MGRDTDLRDMTPRKRNLGNRTGTHREKIKEFHQQTWSRDHTEQKVEKSDQLGRMRMRTCGCSINFGEQTTDNLGKRVLTTKWLPGPPCRKNIQNDHQDN